MTIDIIKRIDCRLDGRSLLSFHEQMLGDCRDEIIKLREQVKHLEQEIKTLVAFKDETDMK